MHMTASRAQIKSSSASMCAAECWDAHVQFNAATHSSSGTTSHKATAAAVNDGVRNNITTPQYTLDLSTGPAADV